MVQKCSQVLLNSESVVLSFCAKESLPPHTCPAGWYSSLAGMWGSDFSS